MESWTPALTFGAEGVYAHKRPVKTSNAPSLTGTVPTMSGILLRRDGGANFDIAKPSTQPCVGGVLKWHWEVLQDTEVETCTN